MSISVSDEYKTEIAAILAGMSGLSRESVFGLIEIPKNEEHGDFSIPIPKLRLQGNPAEIAADYVRRFSPTPLITAASHIGPFLNFAINKHHLLSRVVPQALAEKENYGCSKAGEGQTVIVEFSSPNIAKPFHAGHLRTTIIGNFLRNLYKSQGFHVVGINYLGDWGKQYGLLAVGFAKYGDEEALQADAIRHLFDVYVKITADAEIDPTLHDQAREYFRKMELGDEDALSLWRRFRDLSIEKYKVLYERLNVEFDVYSGESHFDEGMKRANERLQQMALLEESKGAQIIDLTPYKLGKAVIIKSDGASLYLTRDIASAEWRYEEFKFNKMFYVVGAAQDLHFQQLFKIIELSKRPYANRCEHINFGQVMGMSTRRGNVVFLEDIIEESKAEMHKVMRANEAKYAQIEDPDKTAEILAVSAIKIQDFSARRIRDYSFSMDRMTSFEGDTGPYLQYAHARLCSVERKTALQLPQAPDQIDLSLLVEPEALQVALLVARYPNVLAEALKTNEACGLVNFLMALAHAVSNAWEKLWVMGKEEPLAIARLALYKAARYTLGNGLSVLGIKPLERM